MSLGFSVRRQLVNGIAGLRPGDHISYLRTVGAWHHEIVTNVDQGRGSFEAAAFSREEGTYVRLALFPRNFQSVHKVYPIHKILYRAEKPAVRIYTDEEVVQRAKLACLGKENFSTRYRMLKNNCEHFSVWCKTGHSHCFEAEDVVTVGTKFVSRRCVIATYKIADLAGPFGPWLLTTFLKLAFAKPTKKA